MIILLPLYLMLVEHVSLIKYLSDQMREIIKLHERLIRSHVQTISADETIITGDGDVEEAAKR